MRNKRWKRKAKRLLGVCSKRRTCGNLFIRKDEVICPHYTMCRDILDIDIIPSDYDIRTLEQKCKEVK